MRTIFSISIAIAIAISIEAQELTYPPMLPDGKTVLTMESQDLLKPTETLLEGVAIAKTPPRVDFMFYPEQTYPGNPWSVWGDGLTANGKYYSSIGDHIGPVGNAFVYEYDPAAKSLKTIVNVKDVLKMPEGHYTPGKVHSRIDLGVDGWLYFSTHRGSTRVTIDKYHFKGDWVLRHHPGRGVTEIVAHGPVAKHCIPTGRLDPQQLIFYGGTAAGDRTDKTVKFFAWDVKQKKVLHTADNGPYRYLIHAPSTGRMYYCSKDYEPLMRYEPASGKPPVATDIKLGLRAATNETKDGFVYTVSNRKDGRIWQFNTKTEEARELGAAAVGSQTYVTSIDVDPTGRFVYYSAGAHGGSEKDGTPIVQFDVKTGKKKVIAFLHPVLQKHTGYVPIGTFGSDISEDGSKLYVTWNGSRKAPGKSGKYGFDTCAMTVVHIPESER